ncbi:MAG: GNAT family N-acetyltransferase [Pirellulaceae bacterium]
MSTKTPVTELVFPAGFQLAPRQHPQPDLPSLDFETVVIRDWAELRQRLPQWQRLVETAIEPNAYYEPQFLLPALEHLASRRVSVLVVEAPIRVRPDDRRVICGLFPLESKRTLRGFPVSTSEMWQHPHCFLTTPLVRRDVAQPVINAFVDWHACQRNRLLHIPSLGSAGMLDNLLTENLYQKQMPRMVRDRHTRAVALRRSTAGEAFKAGISRKRRHELKRRHRQLEKLGRVTSEIFEPEMDLVEWIEQFLRLEASGWKGRAQTAIGQLSDQRNFFECMIGQAAAADRLSMLRLKLDETTIAIKINLLSDGGAFCFKIAYDERYAEYSPGVLLELETINWLHDQPDSLCWLDSCATADHPMINSVWADRRNIESVIIPSRRWGAALAAAMVPALRVTKQSMRHALIQPRSILSRRK